MKRTSLLTIMIAAFGCVQVQAANIGNWSSSGRSWNAGEFTTVKASAIGAGHTVEANGGISAANLAGDDVFIVGEATGAPSVGELGDLGAWVNAGGILLVFSDSSSAGVSGGNSILSSLGTGMSFSGSGTASGSLAGGNFATEGPPYNIVGQSLSTSLGNVVSGGVTLFGFGLHYAQVGSGYVYAFGDRFDHNFFGPNSSTVNGKLFLNILGGAGAPSVPEAGQTATLLAFAAGLLFLGAKRQRTA